MVARQLEVVEADAGAREEPLHAFAQAREIEAVVRHRRAQRVLRREGPPLPVARRGLGRADQPQDHPHGGNEGDDDAGEGGTGHGGLLRGRGTNRTETYPEVISPGRPGLFGRSARALRSGDYGANGGRRPAGRHASSRSHAGGVP